MTKVDGSAAVITGAASGIGRALAVELAARGSDVALADRDKSGLEAAAAEIEKAYPRKVSIHLVDVADRAQVDAMAREAVAAHPNLNIVINNAGVALIGDFHELEPSETEWLMNINFWGVWNSTRAFLPQLKSQPEAHLVNVSSIYGIIAPPGQTAYAAAKFAVRGFSEALRHELAMMQSPVRLSIVHPGAISTNITRNSKLGSNVVESDQRRVKELHRFDVFAQTAPSTAAKRIIQGIETNEPRILIGTDARQVDRLQRIMPSTYWARILPVLEKMTGQKW